jgi:DNA-binding transcriptional LysR family regulator
MKLDHLQQFVLVVETGSFTNAADFCGIPKSTISRNISNLEQDLGTRLLQRTTRTLNLTDTGETFYQRALSILEQVEETEKELSEGQLQVKGKLVAYVPTLILDKCRHHVADFVNEHPECELELHSTAFGQRAVLDKRFDLLVYIGEPFDSSFIATPLADIGYDYFASPDYLERHGTPEEPDDIFAHRLVYRSSNEHDPTVWQFGDENLAIKPSIVCDSPYMINAFLNQGVGIGQLPQILAAASVAKGHLVRLFDGKYAYRRNIYGMYSSRRYLPHKVNVLIEEIKSKLPGEIERLEGTLKEHAVARLAD